MQRFVAAFAALALFLILPKEAFSASPFKINSIDVGVSAVGGLSLVGGAWRDEVDVFSEDFGQDTSTGLFPAFAASAFAATRFGSLWRVGLSLGAGSWGGRVSSEGGSAGDRLTTIAGIGIELVPNAGIRVPLGVGEFGADLKLGFGYLVTPLWIRDAWADASATASYDLSGSRRPYFLTGADLSYAFPVGAYSVAALISADLGLASFEENGDTSMLGRFGIGVSLSREIALNKGKRR
jgi:hypothetical protein